MLENLHRALWRNGYKQTRIAAAAGISSSRLSQIVHGQAEASQWERAKLAELLGEAEAYLFQKFPCPPLSGGAPVETRPAPISCKERE